MNTITIQTEINSLEQSDNKTVTGVIFFDFNTYQFPTKGWNDFIIIILDWWLSAMNKMAFQHSNNEDLEFMDGGFYIRIEKLDNDLCNILCFESGSTDNLEFSGQYLFSEIYNSIIYAAKTTINMCSKNGWKSEDISNLIKNIKRTSSLNQLQNHQS